MEVAVRCYAAYCSIHMNGAELGTLNIVENDGLGGGAVRLLFVTGSRLRLRFLLGGNLLLSERLFTIPSLGLLDCHKSVPQHPSLEIT